MATNITELMETDVSAKFQADPTVSIFGRPLSVYVLFSDLLNIIMIVFVTLILHSKYKLLDSKLILSIFLGFITYLVYDIFMGEKRTGDLLYEKEHLRASNYNLQFLTGILAIIIIFFNNIAPYTAVKNNVFQILIVAFILNVMLTIEFQVQHRNTHVHMLRRIQESIYMTIIYMLVISFIYGFFMNKNVVK
jgi:hypothetical protein